MKRYRMKIKNGDMFMQVHPDGEYVRFEDSEPKLKCNCARMVNAPPYTNSIPLNLYAFICPVHGYKKV